MDNRRITFGVVATVCLAVAGGWYAIAQSESAHQQELDRLSNSSVISDDLEDISRKMRGEDARVVGERRDDPSKVPIVPITILLLIGVSSAGAAIAVRPREDLSPMPPDRPAG